ncbi:hypothetical protein K402DRAFT_139049 [Aulographum hederae CBS 113979]|uniref:Uncharacterized protein n=1 Tax=Aulographum hederae CBS 113979 TaxID=1176131 RepID=A0A6G1GUT2_9PEZI|nr:hypothetical protein K402DRAFT_139049 [Aulographum hederae CBS 113979]
MQWPGWPTTQRRHRAEVTISRPAGPAGSDKAGASGEPVDGGCGTCLWREHLWDLRWTWLVSRLWRRLAALRAWSPLGLLPRVISGRVCLMQCISAGQGLAAHTIPCLVGLWCCAFVGIPSSPPTVARPTAPVPRRAWSSFLFKAKSLSRRSLIVLVLIHRGSRHSFHFLCVRFIRLVFLNTSSFVTFYLASLWSTVLARSRSIVSVPSFGLHVFQLPTCPITITTLVDSPPVVVIP